MGSHKKYFVIIFCIIWATSTAKLSFSRDEMINTKQNNRMQGVEKAFREEVKNTISKNKLCDLKSQIPVEYTSLHIVIDPNVGMNEEAVKIHEKVLSLISKEIAQALTALQIRSYCFSGLLWNKEVEKDTTLTNYIRDSINSSNIDRIQFVIQTCEGPSDVILSDNTLIIYAPVMESENDQPYIEKGIEVFFRENFGYDMNIPVRNYLTGHMGP